MVQDLDQDRLQTPARNRVSLGLPYVTGATAPSSRKVQSPYSDHRKRVDYIRQLNSTIPFPSPR
jgi:hypothetical protein